MVRARTIAHSLATHREAMSTEPSDCECTQVLPRLAMSLYDRPCSLRCARPGPSCCVLARRLATPENVDRAPRARGSHKPRLHPLGETTRACATRCLPGS